MPKAEDHDAKSWAENDDFTQLATTADLSVSELVIIRSYCKALRQMGLIPPLSEGVQILKASPAFIHQFYDAFADRFSRSPFENDRHCQEQLVLPKCSCPPKLQRRRMNVGRSHRAISQNELFRRLYNLLSATVRTNFYQHDIKGKPKSFLSLKFSCHHIDDLPEPKPLYEIFVYSPRVEGCHLRSALIARGGIRWSNRLQDYRSEVLQLMKTQTLKNAIIVPSGAKGGFICKQFETLKAEGATPERLRQEVKDCYEIFIRGLLDLTDNNDPYLVVAADKGTADFSDFANAIAKEYNFWLGDAFASGGSNGYDHKKMAITSRGAWISVRRHFYELGIDCQTETITVVGIGDMSGDVFGNGMLQSQQLCLVAAFDHRHIFLDPNPNPLKAYKERLRLFNLPHSSWADYRLECLSEGGGVFDRSVAMIPLSKEACGALNIDPALKHISPNELITLLLKAPADLLWFGGVGTFVKSSQETHPQVQDASNDAIRVNADQVQARVMGEGANLGMTQQARIEYALQGGRLNTDSLDNSAGVDCSDHEVNLKILSLPSDVLSQATAEVVEKVLTDNSAQTLILSLERGGLKDEAAIKADWEKYQNLIRFLEQQSWLHFNSSLEGLADDQNFQKRIPLGQALTRPERAAVMAYAKIYLSKQFLRAFQENSELASSFQKEYRSYFPSTVVKSLENRLDDHPLKLEILSTVLSNKVVNIMGPCWCIQTAQTQQMPEIEVVLKFLELFSVYEKEWENVAKQTLTRQPEPLYQLLRDIQKKVAATISTIL